MFIFCLFMLNIHRQPSRPMEFPDHPLPSSRKSNLSVSLCLSVSVSVSVSVSLSLSHRNGNPYICNTKHISHANGVSSSPGGGTHSPLCACALPSPTTAQLPPSNPPTSPSNTTMTSCPVASHLRSECEEGSFPGPPPVIPRSV